MGQKKLHYICNQAHVLKATVWYKLALKLLGRVGEVAAGHRGYSATGDTQGQGEGAGASAKKACGCYVGAIPQQGRGREPRITWTRCHMPLHKSQLHT